MVNVCSVIATCRILARTYSQHQRVELARYESGGRLGVHRGRGAQPRPPGEQLKHRICVDFVVLMSTCISTAICTSKCRSLEMLLQICTSNVWLNFEFISVEWRIIEVGSSTILKCCCSAIMTQLVMLVDDAAYFAGVLRRYLT